MSSVGQSLPRIAVTGLGCVTPYAASLEPSWARLAAGESAVRWLEASSSLGDETTLQPVAGRGGTHGNWDLWMGAPARLHEFARDPFGSAAATEPTLRMARQSAGEAIAQAGLLAGVDPQRIACVFGTSKGGLHSAAEMLRSRRADRPVEDSSSQQAHFWECIPPSAAAADLSARLSLQGPCLAPVAACATGLVALIRAAHLLRDGMCDAVLAGSSDASLQIPVLASFRRLGVLADRAFAPGEACRPFDRDRSGFAIGEGAGALVLERWEHAIARGAPVLAEWVDGLERGDPSGVTLLPADPVCLVRLVQDLLERNQLTPHDIDAVSLHGTGTVMNDRYEAAALQRVFGSDWGETVGFAIKGGIGHLLGAAGSVEAVFCIAALQRQELPPTINSPHRAPDCPIPLSGPFTSCRRLQRILKLSLGFGGHLSAALLVAGPPMATVGNSSESV